MKRQFSPFKSGILAAFLIISLSLKVLPATAEESFIEATETEWGSISNNDGFSKSFTIYKDADNVGYSDYGDDITYSFEIQCKSRRLVALVYSEPLGMYPATNFPSSTGTGLVRVDSGKITKYTYTEMKGSDGVSFNTPKTLTSAILKGKRSFSFKITSSIQADSVANFSIGNLSSYVNRFKSMGCPLK